VIESNRTDVSGVVKVSNRVSQVTAVTLRIEDRVGALAEVLSLLRDSGMKMVAIASQRRTGTALMLIPYDLEAVRKLAAERNILVSQRQVFMVEGDDGVGVLCEATQRIADAGINIEDIAALSTTDKYAAVLTFSDADLEAAGEALGF